ncbi:MAG: hypothetical protein WD358_07765 [Nitriliruptoraceae bacterium]
MAAGRPPAYAWDWFARQRLLWRETHSRLAAGSHPSALRYSQLVARSEVVPLLRSDYQRDNVVRDTVNDVVRELAFLGRTDRPFASLGVINAPRGLVWWWTLLTGEVVGSPAAHLAQRATQSRSPHRQLTLDDVFEGYGDR